MATRLHPSLQLCQHVNFTLQAGKFLADMPSVRVDGEHALFGRLFSVAAFIPLELGSNGNALGSVASRSENGEQINGGPERQVHFHRAIRDDLLDIDLSLFRQALKIRLFEEGAFRFEASPSARQSKVDCRIPFGKKTEPHADFKPHTGHTGNR